ncbi:hypothetical protein ASPACDRAFT_61390 [Aspergillus aculeatus ATCC 16872]|uniref:FAD/NAD(P)-binding domain-containing protein n=1 Tax=Aspergillus aculeatus (strain ATCC 16872 / CBS 172.66 / WB 5094) TaxID=690307 RepID=A0A1L9WR46_ASPA1|nr:uncharacterized protein ASPACDRAFT_61390 [Aspergillus aculeatus ATCC 16872]OJJ98665.1 hypothetical protein ASPACDRAFT_61390 [Aspergillus aculeatus ATCC 16872]
MKPTHDAVVVGAGPGGMSTVAALLDAGAQKILWVDPAWQGGRLNSLYREISSNTTVAIYLKALNSSRTLRSIIDSTPSPNAVTALEAMDPNSTCHLSIAGEMICMLIEGLLARPEVEKLTATVEEAHLEKNIWTLTTTPPSPNPITTARTILSTGAHPRTPTTHQKYNPNLHQLDLDTCMRRSLLPNLLPRNQPSTIAVIGNSHSGILVVRNLYELAQSSPNQHAIKILNFHRRPIRYAIYTDEGIIFDNTGLKGATAEWAREVLERSPDPEIVEFVDDGEDEEAAFREWLPRCTHVVWAVGYERGPIPRVYVEGRRVDGSLEFDMRSSGFRVRGWESEEVKGLYGTGIAFPEEVEDPEGHVEAAVGVAKFVAFTQRVKEGWMGRGGDV